jgi:hypothetical protein
MLLLCAQSLWLMCSSCQKFGRLKLRSPLSADSLLFYLNPSACAGEMAWISPGKRPYVHRCDSHSGIVKINRSKSAWTSI